MTSADAPYNLYDSSEALPLPISDIKEPTLHDPSGGVLLLQNFRQFLANYTGTALRREPVNQIIVRGDQVAVATDAAEPVFDQVIIAAGAGSIRLTQGSNLDVPSTLTHHFRFTFPLRSAEAAFPAWIADVRGLSTYQHMNAPGQWAVGAHLDPVKMAWNVDRSTAEDFSRNVVTDYVRQQMPDVEPRAVEVIHCSVNPSIGDGYQILRSGPVIAVHGENLFKIGAALGALLGDAAVTGATPPSID